MIEQDRKWMDKYLFHRFCRDSLVEDRIVLMDLLDLDRRHKRIHYVYYIAQARPIRPHNLFLHRI